MSEDRERGRNVLSRRTLLKSGAAAGFAAALGGAGAGAAAAVGGDGTKQDAPTPGPGTGSETLNLVNGRIYTMDPRNTVVSGVSIRNGRFERVGGRLLTAARTIDLRGRVVVPGIIDNHNHIILMGNRPGYHTPLENAYSIRDVQAIYRARAARIPAGGWITTIGGFHRNHLVPPPGTPRLPTLQELDAAVPNNPAYISEGFNGPSVTNSRGKQFFESKGILVGADGSIAANVPFGPGMSGQATLELRKELLTFAQRMRGAIDALAYGLSLGVTTHLDQGAFQKSDTNADGAAHEDNFSMHLPFLQVFREGKGKARVRINFLHMEENPAVPELQERLKNQFPFFGGDMIKTAGIGEFIAGPILQGPAPSPQFVNAARKIAERRWRAEVHSLTGNDYQGEIIGFETADAEYDIGDLRWVIAHALQMTEPWVNRLKALGGGISLTGFAYLAGSMGAGPPFRMIARNGINAGLSSDGMQIAPMNPWIHMYYANTGKNARGVVINGSQTITRHEALALYTSRNGWFLREENDLGTIQPGKFADLAVIDRNYFTVPAEELKRIRSVLTLVGGRIVHGTA